MKDLKQFYILIVIISVLWALIYSLTNMSGYTLIGIMLIIGIFAGVFGFSINRVNKINKLIPILSDCEPEKFVYENELLYKKYSKDKYLKNLILNNLCAGNMDKGEFDKAVNALKNTEFKEKKIDIIKASVIYNFSSVSFELKDIQTAMFYYEKLKSYRDLTKDKNVLLFLEKNIPALDAVIDIEQGRYEQALVFFQNQFKQAPDLRMRVYSQYGMSGAYEGMGETVQMKACLEYVAANGKNTYPARVAREKLGGL